MAADYKRRRELQSLWEVARGFSGGRLPSVLVMTDPRKPDPELDLWPGPVGVIYRHFGAEDRVAVAERLRQATFAGGHKLLIGEDPELAVAVGADGVHFRRDAAVRAPEVWRRRCPEWLMTMAGVKLGGYSGDLSVLDGLLVSSVFASDSPSAGTPIGVAGLQNHVKMGVPVFALGGVDAGNISQLIGSGISGVAGVGFRRRDMMENLTITKEVHGEAIRLVATHTDFPGLEAELDLKPGQANEYVATHTGVPKPMEGKGVAAKLFDAMVIDARENGYKVVGACPYIAMRFKRKPETQDVRSLGSM